MDDHYRIRDFDRADLDAIHRIETSVFSDPWFREALASAAGDIALVAASERGVIGYLFARRAADEAEILNLAVHPAERRHGVATALLEEAYRRIVAVGGRVAFLEVRASNQAAQAFYEGAGFQVVGRRRRYYRHPAEDALVLARRLEGVDGRA